MSFKKFLMVGTTGVVGAYASAVAYNKFTAGVCKSTRDLNGQTVIVTGGSAGIGLETARDLAARNARVILACRDPSKGEKALQDIVSTTGNTNVVLKELDVSSFESVRAFAKDVLANEKRLDVLVNNAGVMVLQDRKKKSADGLEMTMATNHYGPFLLTNLLLPLLKDSSPSRIVVVSSLAHEKAKIDPENMDKDKKCKGRFGVYGKSKLANVLFTRELSERLKDTGVTVNALHPGVVKTELGRHMTRRCDNALKWFFQPLMKNAKEGAQTSIHVAVSEELEGVTGKYFSDCKEKPLKKNALDDNVSKKLWEHSEQVTKLSPTQK